MVKRIFRPMGLLQGKWDFFGTSRPFNPGLLALKKSHRTKYRLDLKYLYYFLIPSFLRPNMSKGYNFILFIRLRSTSICHHAICWPPLPVCDFLQEIIIINRKRAATYLTLYRHSLAQCVCRSNFKTQQAHEAR